MSQRVVYKYSLPWFGGTSILMAVGPVIHVAEQQGSLCLWMEADLSEPARMRTFHVVTTGSVFEMDGLEHVGSAITGDGAYVVHVYEQGSQP